MVCAELKSFIQELKSQLTTIYRQFAPLPIPPADNEQLREKLNRLYVGASSVPATKAGSGDTSSTSLPSSVGAGEVASYSCTASLQEEQGLQALPHTATTGAASTSAGLGDTSAPNDVHVSDWGLIRVHRLSCCR